MPQGAERLRRYDPADMYSKILNFPQQLCDGFGLPISGDLSSITGQQIRAIVIAGMGGSAIGGDILRSYLAEQLAIPIVINRTYTLPRFVDRSTLVIASSYSGNTEETLAAFAEAKKRGCPRFVATTGGKLGELARSESLPHVVLPSGYQPRAALGYSFGPLLNFMEKSGLSGPQAAIVTAACDFLTRRAAGFAADKPEIDNMPLALAKQLVGRIAIVYAGADYYDTCAIRFKGQICENAKQLAYANINPEFNHNEIVGYEFPKDLLKKLFVIFLTGPGDCKGVANRHRIIKEIVTEKGIATYTVRAEGPNRLAEIFSLIQFGDFVSYYLALENETDPSPVHVINRLKSALEAMN